MQNRKRKIDSSRAIFKRSDDRREDIREQFSKKKSRSFERYAHVEYKKPPGALILPSWASPKNIFAASRYHLRTSFFGECWKGVLLIQLSRTEKTATYLPHKKIRALAQVP